MILETIEAALCWSMSQFGARRGHVYRHLAYGKCGAAMFYFSTDVHGTNCDVLNLYLDNGMRFPKVALALWLPAAGALRI